MSADAPSPADYTGAERRADAIVHAAGLAFALIGCAVLVIRGFPAGDALQRLALGVYGVGLVTMISCSALYNLTRDSRRKALFRRFDHAAIFLMIAGTYTPFLLLTIGGTRGTGLLMFVWAVAIAGAAVKLAWPHRFERASISAYLVLGWTILAALDPLMAAMSPSQLALLAAGGVLYSVGVVFHIWNRLPYQNAIWHAFVLAAAACHYAAVMVQVAAG